MDNKLENLSKIFNGKIFRIPDYQRGYAWRRNQLVDFWEDLLNLEKDKSHYTGLLSFKLIEDEAALGQDRWILDKDYQAYHIVDGQQRLTTFIILLNELVRYVRNLEQNKGKTDYEIYINRSKLYDIITKYLYQKDEPDNLITTYIFSYEKDNPSAKYLKYKIMGEPNAGTVIETYYTKNLYYAKEFFAININQVYKEKGMDGLAAIYDKLTRFLTFNTHEITDTYNVFVAFETMNNRGKKLSNLELLKNRLIYLTTIFTDEQLSSIGKEALRNDINNAWKEVYYQLGRNNQSLYDDDFLRVHWIIFFTYSRKSGSDYIEYLLDRFSTKNIFDNKITTILNTDGTPLNQVGCIGNERLQPSDIHDYVASIKEIAQYWYYTFYPEDAGFLTIEEKDWLKKLNRIGSSSFVPLLTVILSKNYDKFDRMAAFKAIERYIFITFKLGNRNSSYRNTEFYRRARELYGIKEGAVEKLREIIKDLNDSASRELDYSIQTFTTKIKEDFRNFGGYYYWNSLHYFMYEYEYELMQRRGIKKLDWEPFTKYEKDKLSIEHILPQTPTNEYWQERFGQFNPEQLNYLTGALGNLLPLSQSINSSLQNDSFDDKRNPSNPSRCGYKHGSYSEIEVADFEEWTAEEILARSEKLISFMEKRWKISIKEPYRSQLIDMSLEITVSTDSGNRKEKKEEKSKRNKYKGLTEYLKDDGTEEIILTKEDIEGIIGSSLPITFTNNHAYVYKSNPIGDAAYKAGYKAAWVDNKPEKIKFEKQMIP